MERVILLAVLTLSVGSQPITDSQRLFTMAVSRVQHLHVLAQRYFGNFENSLGSEEKRQLNKIFLQDFCNSDYIISPIDKHETQRSSVLELLLVSYRLVESWEVPSRSLSALSRDQISAKLSELKTGLQLLIRTNQEAAFVEGGVALGPFEDYDQRLSPDQNLRRSYELLACFRKDMHKVETYLTVAMCRLSPEANCTL
uniref:Somatotropin n=2 Tax=Leucopsarion petersii TaxID=167318 RepID=F1T0N0_9GOBI|nr:growth hormone [Leucopsarion petersii]BAM31231.1 growth hormone [Leucopsarion petersii]BAM31232.1 growth Hormone [Leucopsarion petersii]